MLKRAVGVSVATLALAAMLQGQGAHAPMRISNFPGPGSFQHHQVPRAFYPGFPLWADSYLPANDSAPSVIVVQPPAPPAERVTAIPDGPKSAAPLLIEWQGDRYVRRTSATTTSARDSQPDYVADTKLAALTNNKPVRSSALQSKGDRTSNPSEPPPTTFIFRDGHREESDNYSIISGVIYARGDYWATGQWSKQIKLSQLDLPATVKANQQHGVTFRVPAASNEVITRP
jgi:hypothetical protein